MHCLAEGARHSARRASICPPASGRSEGDTDQVSAAWAGPLAAAVVLVLLFILENGSRVKVSYFGASGHLPLGVALLLAAVGGALLIGIIGVARVVQSRLTARRHRRPHTRAISPPATTANKWAATLSEVALRVRRSTPARWPPSEVVSRS